MNSTVKKVILIIVLAIVVALVGVVVFFASQGKRETETQAQTVEHSGSNVKEDKNEEKKEEPQTITEGDVEITRLSDGTLYQIKGREETPDIIIKDNYFDTQVTDMTINVTNYVGKVVQLEGMYFITTPYTFVGRYSTNSMCPTCPAGISYYEYEWHSDKKIELEDEKSWIKITGKITIGQDEHMEYPYIDVSSIEVMDQAGQKTVNN